MKRSKRTLLRTLLCLTTFSPVMVACSCSKSEQKQNIEYKITKGNAPNGRYTLVYDEETNRVKVNAIPNKGYEFSRAYYVHTDNPSIEYEITEEGFIKPNANITVYVKFVEKEEEPPVLTAQLNLQQNNHGTISADNTTPKAGDTVNITLQPNEGYFTSKLYYLKHDGSEVEITNNSFTMIDEPIVVKAEFTKFYGTYKVLNSTDDLAFFSIDKKITVGFSSIGEDNNGTYSLATYTYLINENIVTYVDNNDTVHNITLGVNQLTDTQNETTTLYTLITNSDLSYGRYNRIDYTSKDLDYIWNEDGSFIEVKSENTGVFIEENEIANATLYGDILVLTMSNNITSIFKITSTSTHYVLKGKEFNSSDNTFNNREWLFTPDKASGKTTLTQSEYGTYEVVYNSTTGRLEILTTPDVGYIIYEKYYLKEGSNVKYHIPAAGFERPGNDNITIYVTFKVDPSYPIRSEIATNITGGEVTLNTLKMLNVGDEVSITPTPKDGYYLKEVYYLTSDNQKVIIEDNKFIMIDDVVTVNATFIKYYGTYFITNVVDSNDKVIAGSANIVENNVYNFIYIDETGVYIPLIETIENRYYSKYEMIKGTYEFKNGKIIFTFKIGSKTLTQELRLQDEKLLSNYSNGSFLQYSLSRESGFIPGPFEVIEITETLTEFIFNEDGTVTSVTNGDRVEVGTYKQYGNIVLIYNYDDTLDICTLTKNNNTIVISGMRIHFSIQNTNSNNTNLFYWTFIFK